MRTRRVDERTTAPELMRLDEAERRYRVSVRWLRSRIHRGELAYVRPPGTKSYYVRPTDLERLLAPKVNRPPAKVESEDEAAERQLRQAGVA